MRHALGLPPTRFWFEFDLDGHRPSAAAPGSRNLGGGTVQYRWLSFGAGVTGRDEDDALGLLRAVVDADLPPVVRSVEHVYVDRVDLGIPDSLAIGDPSRRGVWFPAENLHGLP